MTFLSLLTVALQLRNFLLRALANCVFPLLGRTVFRKQLQGFLGHAEGELVLPVCEIGIGERVVCVRRSRISHRVEPEESNCVFRSASLQMIVPELVHRAFGKQCDAPPALGDVVEHLDRFVHARR